MKLWEKSSISRISYCPVLLTELRAFVESTKVVYCFVFGSSLVVDVG